MRKELFNQIFEIFKLNIDAHKYNASYVFMLAEDFDTFLANKDSNIKLKPEDIKLATAKWANLSYSLGQLFSKPSTKREWTVDVTGENGLTLFTLEIQDFSLERPQFRVDIIKNPLQPKMQKPQYLEVKKEQLEKIRKLQKSAQQIQSGEVTPDSGVFEEVDLQTIDSKVESLGNVEQKTSSEKALDRYNEMLLFTKNAIQALSDVEKLSSNSQALKSEKDKFKQQLQKLTDNKKLHVERFTLSDEKEYQAEKQKAVANLENLQSVSQRFEEARDLLEPAIQQLQELQKKHKGAISTAIQIQTEGLQQLLKDQTNGQLIFDHDFLKLKNKEARTAWTDRLVHHINRFGEVMVILVPKIQELKKLETPSNPIIKKVEIARANLEALLEKYATSEPYSKLKKATDENLFPKKENWRDNLQNSIKQFMAPLELDEFEVEIDQARYARRAAVSEAPRELKTPLEVKEVKEAKEPSDMTQYFAKEYPALHQHMTLVLQGKKAVDESELKKICDDIEKLLKSKFSPAEITLLTLVARDPDLQLAASKSNTLKEKYKNLEAQMLKKVTELMPQIMNAPATESAPKSAQNTASNTLTASDTSPKIKKTPGS